MLLPQALPLFTLADSKGSCIRNHVGVTALLSTLQVHWNHSLSPKESPEGSRVDAQLD